MKSKYECPHCNAQLNVGSDIIFTVKTAQKNMGLFLISPQIGDYSVVKDTLFKVEQGEHLEILCPVCHARLQVGQKNENLAMIHFINENGEQSEVYFSEIFGEQCTYKIFNKQVEIFGDDANKYNFWGLAPNY